MRIFTSNNIPLDFCFVCAPKENKARKEYGHIGDGPDNRGNCFAYDTEHPPYEPEQYYCHNCGDELSQDCD